jgi:Tat protein translocase TatB subunit
MGFWELVLVLIILFLVVGPKKLPEVARELGKGVRWLQKNYTDFKVAVTKEAGEVNTGVQECNKTKS